MNNENIRDELQSQEQNNKKKKQNKIIVIIILILLFLFLVYCKLLHSDVSKGEIEWDQPKASRDLQAEIDKAVEQGMFNVFMNTNVIFKDGQSKGNMMIQNIDTNLYPMYVEIYHDDTLLYKSNIIDPGYKIEEAKLDTTLSKGTYDCTAYFYVTDSDKEEVQNKIGLNIKITVNN